MGRGWCFPIVWRGELLRGPHASRRARCAGDDRKRERRIARRGNLVAAGTPAHADSRRRKIDGRPDRKERSEEHTSELQSQSNLVCRLLLEKKKKKKQQRTTNSTKRLRAHHPHHAASSS